MIQLSSTDDAVSIVTGAAADIEVHASWVDNASGTITPGRTNTVSLTSSTDAVIVSAPAAATQRRVKTISVRNNHAATASTVTIQHTDGTNVETLIYVNLLAGETLTYGSRWVHYDTNGGEYPRTLTYATKADMEDPSSGGKVVSPGVQHNHPGHPKFWVSAIQYNYTALPTDSYNLTSISDVAAGRMGCVIATDFSGADYAVLATLERLSTSLTVTNVKYCTIRNATLAAGQLEIEVYDGTATTHVQEDAGYLYVVGLGDQ